MSEFNFGNLKKKEPIKYHSTPKPVKKSVFKRLKPINIVEKSISLDEYITKYESVIKAMLQLFEGHVIRHDQKNPISRISVDIASLSFDPQFWRENKNC